MITTHTKNAQTLRRWWNCVCVCYASALRLCVTHLRVIAPHSLICHVVMYNVHILSLVCIYSAYDTNYWLRDMIRTTCQPCSVHYLCSVWAHFCSIIISVVVVVDVVFCENHFFAIDWRLSWRFACACLRIRLGNAHTTWCSICCHICAFCIERNAALVHLVLAFGASSTHTHKFQINKIT